MPEETKLEELKPIDSQSLTPDALKQPDPTKKSVKRRLSVASMLSKHPSAMLFSTTALVLAGMLIAGAIILFFAGYPIFRPTASKNPTDANSTTLSPEAIEQLGKSSTSLGSSNQNLVIAATSQFTDSVGITRNLSVNGTTTVGDLKVNGQFSPKDMSLSGNLTVAGLTVLQKGVTIQDFLNIVGALNVGGSGSVGGAFTAASLNARSASINGPLTVTGHLTSGGASPGISAGGGVGGGGTVSLSGNDTAGSININTGTGASAGTLASISFASGYSGTPHVIISPTSSAASSVAYYVSRTATGFSIICTNAPTSSATLSFDYMVVK